MYTDKAIKNATPGGQNLGALHRGMTLHALMKYTVPEPWWLFLLAVMCCWSLFPSWQCHEQPLHNTIP